MDNTIFLDNYYFYNLKFTKYHYTDNRKGSPLYYLAYMINGTGRIVSDETTVLIEEGDVFFIPKNVGYQSYWYGNEKIRFLSFGFVELQTRENLNFNLQKINCDDKIKSRIMNIPTEGGAVSCKALSEFLGVFADVIPIMESKPQTAREKIIKSARKYITENMTCTIPELAKACYVSEPYLYKVFKNELGITPNEFRLKILADKSVELLRTTDKTIEAISDGLNFSSASYFRKVLKKYIGKTPKEIRKNCIF